MKFPQNVSFWVLEIDNLHNTIQYLTDNEHFAKLREPQPQVFVVYEAFCNSITWLLQTLAETAD